MAQSQNNRPLSPHLSIYKPMLTMMMSIIHRITGMGLYLGMILYTAWLIAVASGPHAYSSFAECLGSPLGLVVLFGFTWALVHHMLGGLRHLVWDMGYGFGPEAREWMARGTIIGSIVLTVILWACGLSMKG